MSDMAIDLQIRPITVDEYQRMADAGIIDEDERIELRRTCSPTSVSSDTSSNVSGTTR